MRQNSRGQQTGDLGRVNVTLKDLDSCTSLGEINIRMLGFLIQVRIYSIPTRGPCAAFFAVVPG